MEKNKTTTSVKNQVKTVMKKPFISTFSYIGAMLVLFLLSGFVNVQTNLPPETGERVAIDYTCRLMDGTVAATTLAEIGNLEDIPKSEIFKPLNVYRPTIVTVPESPLQVTIDYFGSFEEKIIQHLTRKTIGLPLHEKHTFVLNGAVPFNVPDKERYLKLTRDRTIDRYRVATLEEYLRQKDQKPIPGQIAHEDDNFITTVKSVEDDKVTLYYTAKPDAHAKNAYGIEHFVNENEEKIKVRLDVEKDSLVRTGPLVGKIIEVTDSQFTIDYGHHFAFESLSCEMEAKPITDLGEATGTMSWITDYDQGLSQAKREQKPILLMLYADWCDYCHKMFTEVLQDEQITPLQNSLVWMRINSDVQERYMKQFSQKLFPTLIVLDSSGKELKKLEGFHSVTDLKRELESILPVSEKS